jgi:integrase
VTRIAQLEPTRVTVGVDTHRDVQVAVALDQLGRRLGEIELATTRRARSGCSPGRRAWAWSRRSGSKGRAVTGADAARVAPRQAQLALGTVKQVLRDAMKRGQRVDPALLEVKAPGYEEREPIFLSAAEVEHLASWCAEPRLIVFAALSGLRLGEVLALRDADVNLEDGFVLVRRSARKGVEGRTKTRKRRRVYLCARALKAAREQLLARRPNPHGLVFPSPRSDSVWNSDNFRADVFAKTVKRAAARVEPARRADFDRLDFHDLRHTFASLMIAAGANPLQLAEALGHSDQYGRPDPTLVSKRYGHLYPGSTREAAAALDRHLKAIAS